MICVKTKSFQTKIVSQVALCALKRVHRVPPLPITEFTNNVFIVYMKRMRRNATHI